MWLAVFIMPRFEGVSATTTLCPMRRKPNPRAELRILASCPTMLLIKVTLTDLPLMTLPHDFRDGLAALGAVLHPKDYLSSALRNKALGDPPPYLLGNHTPSRYAARFSFGVSCAA